MDNGQLIIDNGEFAGAASSNGASFFNLLIVHYPLSIVHYFTYLATFRAAVAWEMPSSLATATVVPQRR